MKTCRCGRCEGHGPDDERGERERPEPPPVEVDWNTDREVEMPWDRDMPRRSRRVLDDGDGYW